MQEVCHRKERCYSALTKFWTYMLQIYVLLGANTKTNLTFVYPLCLMLPKHMANVLQGVAFSIQFFQMYHLYHSSISTCCSACKLSLHIIEYRQHFVKWVYCCLCRKWTFTLFRVDLFLVRD